MRRLRSTKNKSGETEIKKIWNPEERKSGETKILGTEIGRIWNPEEMKLGEKKSNVIQIKVKVVTVVTVPTIVA